MLSRLHITHIYCIPCLLAILMAMLSSVTSAQSDSDIKIEVTEPLMNYLNGRNNGNIAMLKSAFHESADLRYMKNDSMYTIWPINDYIKGFQEGRKINCKSRIVYIAISGTSAQAEIEIAYPDKVFTDYINLLQFENNWLIVGKTFASRLLSDEEIQKQSMQWKIDAYIKELMATSGIPGVALAVIKDGSVIHQNNYGYASIEHQVPITEHSIFRLYSLTKPIVAVGIFQLIEAGKLNLNDAVSKYVEGLPGKWNQVKIKHLLSFSSGLPELIEPYNEVKDLNEDQISKRVFSESKRFDVGEKFEYNQTNFWLLQKVIENISGQRLSTFILENQFQNATDTVFFSSDARDIITHRVTPYFPFEKGELTITHPYYQGDYSNALNGLHLTLDDFIKWDKRFANNEFITKKTKDIMWSNFKSLFRN